MAATDLRIFQIDETYIRVEAIGPILYELKDHFSFFAKNYHFHPKYKAGYWDGRISLFKNKELLKGLLPDLITFCEHNSYSYNIDEGALKTLSPYNIDEAKVVEFYRRINGPYVPHDSQIEAFKQCVNEGRNIILAPTSNGKSYIIHGLCNFYAMQKKRILIVIDRSQLVVQLKDDMCGEYGSTLKINTIYEDKPLRDTQVLITTWQSVYENDEAWFKCFDVIIGDELHKFKAASLQTMMGKCGHISIRHGFTATLDNDSLSDRLTLKGMFGVATRVATTAELIAAGIVARPTIYAIELTYDDEVRKLVMGGKVKMEFDEEMKLIENIPERTRFIAKLADNLVGNTLIAFKKEDHGLKIYQAVKNLKQEKAGLPVTTGATIKTIVTDDPIENDLFFANGKVALKTRVEIAKIIDTMKDAIATVSLGTFSTGISIKNVNNLIVGCQLASQITIPQLIGRTLRVTKTKKTSDVYDIGDNMSWAGKENTAYKHWKKRLEIYASEGFEIIIKRKHITLASWPVSEANSSKKQPKNKKSL